MAEMSCIRNTVIMELVLKRYTSISEPVKYYSFNGSQLAKMKKSIPDMSLP